MQLFKKRKKNIDLKQKDKTKQKLEGAPDVDEVIEEIKEAELQALYKEYKLRNAYGCGCGIMSYIEWKAWNS